MSGERGVGPATKAARLMGVEHDRVQRLIQDALLELGVGNGNIACFSVALMRAAMELHIEVFGPDGLGRMVAEMATRQVAMKRGAREN
ncbi:MAG: hypothetical protein INF50_11770 [Rhodobacter sp.]|nr:hypothetical protein [Rhodobacter sp.]